MEGIQRPSGARGGGTTDVGGRSARRATRRLELTAAATALIQERGYERVSVNELAEAAGLSVGGMYRHIRSKADLLVMACEGIYGDLQDRIARATESAAGDATERLGAGMRIYLEACDQNRDRILLMYREYRYLPEDAKRRYIDREQGIADVFSELIRSGMDQGLFRPCRADMVAYDIVLLGHLPALKAWAVEGRMSAGELVEQQIDLLLHSLRMP